jgi:hypothetical protein
LTDKVDKFEKEEAEMQKVRFRVEELENELKEYQLTQVDAKQVNLEIKKNKNF